MKAIVCTRYGKTEDVVEQRGQLTEVLRRFPRLVDVARVDHQQVPKYGQGKRKHAEVDGAGCRQLELADLHSAGVRQRGCQYLDGEFKVRRQAVEIVRQAEAENQHGPGKKPVAIGYRPWRDLIL